MSKVTKDLGRAYAVAPPELTTEEGHVNGAPVKIQTICRLGAWNGYEGVVAIVTKNDRNIGPLVLSPPNTKGWGYDWRPMHNPASDNWDINYAFAHCVRDVILERDELLKGFRELKQELMETGYVSQNSEAFIVLDRINAQVEEAEKAVALDVPE